MKRIGLLASLGVLSLGVGCHSNAVDSGAFKSALNSYYSATPICVWSSPVKFPAQADTSNEEQTKGFDALTDAGMLTRTPAEKKRFLIGSKQVNDYDLSDKGRSTWTADSSEPGYGNFCFGHPEVTSIDSFSPPNDNGATQYSVSYHYGVSSVADWAKSPEMSTAFPKIASATAGQQTATATLVKSNNGWQVTNVNPPASSPATNPPLPQ
ncbi:MAG TPA: hypothetical protein VHX60_14580 [Acidobacteriaceae bacterium]|nr:hypothetical protein [Acidobacteriaceae bacterium]